jgi:exopolysaccharide biosynthesis polyprenyl glycosylphosphotransferase
MNAAPPVNGMPIDQTTRAAPYADLRRSSNVSAMPGLRSITSLTARLADLLVLTVAMIAVVVPAYFTQKLHDPAGFLGDRISVQNLLVLAACWVSWSSLLHLAGVYQPALITDRRNLLLRLYTGVGGCSLVTLATLHSRHAGYSTVAPLLLFFVTALGLACGVRVALAGYDLLLRPHFRSDSRALIVGTDSRAEELAHKLSRDRNFAYRIVGFVEPRQVSNGSVAGRPVLGTIDDLPNLLMREHIDEVLVALPVRSFYDEIRQVLMLCEESGVRSQYFADLFTTSVTKRRATEGDNEERVVLHMVHTDVRQAIKRTFDLTGAALGLLVLSPLLLLSMLCIRLSGPGPIFFSQARYGLNKRRFPMYKFRSMVPDAEAQQAALEHLNEAGGPVFKIKHDPRITPIGRLLRKTSLDELPQLWNVIRGDMSLVGPRPLPMRDVGRFSDLHLIRRFSVKPGMTGLWQVSGRSDTSFDGWIKLDLFYIDNWSLMMDFHILLRTLPAVLRGSGAS